MMKSLHNTFILFALSILMLLTGCAKDTLDNGTLKGRYSSKLLFNVAQSASKAGPTEESVMRLDIMLFKEGTLEKVMKNVTKFGHSSEGQGSVNLSLDEPGLRKAYVVANIDSETWLDNLVIGTTTVEQMLLFKTATLTKMASAPFVMSGISEDINVTDAESSAMCKLYRSVARIDIKNTQNNFKLLSANLVNSKNNSSVFASQTLSDGDVKEFEAVDATDNSQLTLYSYENGIGNPGKATSVKIRGEVNGIPLTYIVDFAMDSTPISIQRNYLYTIQLTGVKDNVINSVITVRPWNLGGNIEHEIDATKPEVTVVIDPAVGTYNPADSTFLLTPQGGLLSLNVQANAACDIVMNANWLINETDKETKANSFIPSKFIIRTEPNLLTETRTGTITIKNKLNPQMTVKYTLTQKASDGKDRYFVIAVAGQSNAAGWDFIPAENTADDAPDPRVFQLSYRLGPKGHENMSIIPMECYGDDVFPNETANKARGVHLPLGKELLKRLPAGSKILVVPVAAGGTSFGAGPTSPYDAAGMRPVNANTMLRWGKGSAYQLTLVDRIRYALNLNPKNELGGIVWCQGEYDRGRADSHYPAFTSMADDINATLTREGYGARTQFGTVDKRSWYCFSSTFAWMEWNHNFDAIAVFTGYKYWSPDTFVHIPIETPVNPTGIGSGEAHFGRGAYRLIVAPLIAQCMNENGALRNGVIPKGDRFINKSTLTDAQKMGGSLADDDIQNNLILHLPFKNSVNEELTKIASISSTNLSLVAADGLTDLNHNNRVRNALRLNETDGTISVSNLPESEKWSVSFMLKRDGDMTKPLQVLMSNNASSAAPFIGFRKYAEGHAVRGIAEFIVEPIYSGTPARAKSALGGYVFADNVRDLNGWIHYVVTYDYTNKETIIYMNGQKVSSTVISTVSTMPRLSSFKIGTGSTSLTSVHGQIIELMVWKDVIESPTVEKLFFYNYYGFTK